MSGKLKKILIAAAAIVLAAYVLLSTLMYRPTSDKVVSRHPVVVIRDSADYPFVTRNEIMQLVRHHGLYLEGVPASEILLDSIEHVVETLPMVRNAECCMLPSGKVKVIVWERIPLMRLLPANGGQYFLDGEGTAMAISSQRASFLALNLPVATGQVSLTDSLMLTQLSDMARRLAKDDYWNHVIQEIEVDGKGRWVFHPAEGKFKIRFGYPEDFSVKLGAIRSFYTEILPKVGPDYYSSLNLEFKDQMICTKRNE